MAKKNQKVDERYSNKKVAAEAMEKVEEFLSKYDVEEC